MARRMARKFIDIGANLTDSMYEGIYNGKSSHQPDLPSVIKRSLSAGLEKIIITGGSLEDSRKALELANSNDHFYTTIGVHPTRAGELEADPAGYIEQMVKLGRENRQKIVAVGEFGLDYERLHFCSKDIQLKNFKAQFELVDQLKLPLFLHCRAAAGDLHTILKSNRDRFSTGVVHSFDGTLEEAQAFIDLDLFIGLNGCSLRTPENLQVVEKIPLERILIETDAPWCEIKASHASSAHVKTKLEAVKKEKWTEEKMVKGRNEPANIVQVLEVICKVKGIDDLDSAAKTIFDNTERMFWSKNP